MRRDGRDGGNIRVLVVDDQDLFRVGLRALLDRDGFEVVAEARTREEAVAVAGRLAPDVVLLGLGQGITAGPATWQLAEVVPDARIVALTDSPDPDEVIDALTAGACGYLARNDATETIVTGIVRAAAAGEPLLSGRTTSALIDRLRRQGAERMRGEALRASLSPRELEVLALIAEGHENREIARLLFISPHTVKHHVHTICEKFGVENRVQAAVRAARAGVI
jgi:DNA-binding NarL/FixJ family response regulator